jgi:SPP1 family predicted phage head-tail adaptor
MMDPLEIADIKASLEETLGETCTIKQRTKANAGTGPTITETDRATNVPCRRASLGDRTGREVNVAGASRDQEEIVLTLRLEQTIKATDRVVFPDRSYEVVRLMTTAHQKFCNRVLCKAE